MEHRKVTSWWLSSFTILTSCLPFTSLPSSYRMSLIHLRKKIELGQLEIINKSENSWKKNVNE